MNKWPKCPFELYLSSPSIPHSCSCSVWNLLMIPPSFLHNTSDDSKIWCLFNFVVHLNNWTWFLSFPMFLSLPSWKKGMAQMGEWGGSWKKKSWVLVEPVRSVLGEVEGEDWREIGREFKWAFRSFASHIIKTRF